MMYKQLLFCCGGMRGMKKEKKYGILDNYKYFGSLWWKYDKVLYALAGGYLLVGLITAVLAAVLPSVIVYFLEENFKLNVTLFIVAGIVIVHVVSQSLSSMFAYFNIFDPDGNTIGITGKYDEDRGEIL